MNHVVVMQSDMTKFGRMDAAFFVLLEQHREAVDELLTFDVGILTRLAREVTYHSANAKIVMAGSYRYINDPVPSLFSRWLDSRNSKRRLKTDLAVYLAATLDGYGDREIAAIERITADLDAKRAAVKAVIERFEVPGLRVVTEAIRRKP